MANWGGLNPALTAWRNGINRRLPGRDTRTDGARADKAHGSTSQHQEDADGTVDAFDQDINVLKSSVSTGSAQEDRIIDAMKLDFEQDPHGRGQLWIEDREIANADVDNWREREYTGDSPHTEHIHWQSRQSKEHIGADWPMPHLDAVLAELGLGGEDQAMIPCEKGDKGEAVKFWQYLLNRLEGAELTIDGDYGPKMEAAVNAYRKKHADATPTTRITGWMGYHALGRYAALFAGKTGAPGPAGPAGAKGPAGPQGPAGPAGKDGVLTGTLAITGGTLTATTQ